MAIPTKQTVKPLSVKFPFDIETQIREIAVAEERSVSQTIVRLVRAGLEKRGENNSPH